MVGRGFKLGLGFAVAVAVVWGVLDVGRVYGECAVMIDKNGPPPEGHACAWVGRLHKPA